MQSGNNLLTPCSAPNASRVDHDLQLVQQLRLEVVRVSLVLDRQEHPLGPIVHGQLKPLGMDAVDEGQVLNYSGRVPEQM